MGFEQTSIGYSEQQPLPIAIFVAQATRRAITWTYQGSSEVSKKVVTLRWCQSEAIFFGAVAVLSQQSACWLSSLRRRNERPNQIWSCPNLGTPNPRMIVSNYSIRYWVHPYFKEHLRTWTPQMVAKLNSLGFKGPVEHRDYSSLCLP